MTDGPWLIRAEKKWAARINPPTDVTRTPNERRAVLMTYSALACRGLIGLVFAVSAFTKLRGRQAFRDFASWLADLPGLPVVGLVGRTPVAAAALALAEAAVVLLVSLPWTWSAGLVFAAVLLAVLAAGVIAVSRAGASTSCRCFGASSMPLGRRHAVRDAALAAVAAIGATDIGPRAARPAQVALSLGLAVVAALFVVFLDDIAAIFAAGEPLPGERD
jgi:hypothetical protein